MMLRFQLSKMPPWRETLWFQLKVSEFRRAVSYTAEHSRYPNFVGKSSRPTKSHRHSGPRTGVQRSNRT